MQLIEKLYMANIVYSLEDFFSPFLEIVSLFLSGCELNFDSVFGIGLHPPH